MKKQTTARFRKSRVKFLNKTYRLVETAPPRLLAWQKDGASFVIRRPNEFEAYAREHGYFKGKFSSFVRQLNFYGFHKIVADNLVKFTSFLYDLLMFSEG